MNMEHIKQVIKKELDLNKKEAGKIQSQYRLQRHEGQHDTLTWVLDLLETETGSYLYRSCKAATQNIVAKSENFVADSFIDGRTYIEFKVWSIKLRGYYIRVTVGKEKSIDVRVHLLEQQFRDSDVDHYFELVATVALIVKEMKKCVADYLGDDLMP